MLSKRTIMRKRLFFLSMAATLALPLSLVLCCQSDKTADGPCDIYAAESTPCVTAHSTTRRLYSKYHGPLYQVRRSSDSQTMDIFTDSEGYANAASQDNFCNGDICVISVIYDQSGMGNDLLQAAPGTFPGPDKGKFNTLPIADMAPVTISGHKAYGVYIIPGMGFRNNNARGLAIDDEAEGIYYVIDGTHFDSGCCFDYGNSSTNGRAVGTGTMETTYYGTATAWGSGNGDGPWLMSDMEAGLFSGYNAKHNDVPSFGKTRFISEFVNGGDGNQWDLRGGDATVDTVKTFYSGVRPGTKEGKNDYFPMNKKGAVLLGNGGDNGNGSAGTFYEGVMVKGYPTDAAINAVQRNIAAQKYAEAAVRHSRLKSFKLGESQTLTVSFTNPSSRTISSLKASVQLPQGWKVENPKQLVVNTTLAPGASCQIPITLSAPDFASAGFIQTNLEWRGGSESFQQKVRCSEPVKINEVCLVNTEPSGKQFIELYNPSDRDIDLSGWRITASGSGSSVNTIAILKEGTVIAPKGFLLLSQAESALSVPAKSGDNEIFLTKPVSTGESYTIGNDSYKIVKAGKAASAPTSIFIPVSTGPWLEIPAGSTNIPLTSVAGIAVGDKLGIDMGGNFEAVSVTFVGTSATQTNLSVAANAGDSRISLTSAGALEAGSVITISTGDRVESATVKFIDGSDVELEHPLEKNHAAMVDVSCPGSGVSFTPATTHSHLSGEQVQSLGTAFTLGDKLSSDAQFPTVLNEGFSLDLSETAGSVALYDASGTVLVDAVVYGSQQSSSSANGTVAVPEIAVLEGNQSQGGSIAVVPGRRWVFPGMPKPKPTNVSIVRFPDGADSDELKLDFSYSVKPSPGSENVIQKPEPVQR